eukprot:SAG22_NODE_8184_length_676_cov_1.057192_1_plen_195_part_10
MQTFMVSQPPQFAHRVDCFEVVVAFLEDFFQNILVRFYLNEEMYSTADDAFERDFKRQPTGRAGAARMIRWHEYDSSALHTQEQDFRLCAQIFECLTVFIEGPNRMIQARMYATKEYAVVGEIAAVLMEYCGSRVFYSNTLIHKGCNGWATKTGRGHIFLNNPYTYTVWMLSVVKDNPRGCKRFMDLIMRDDFEG